MPNTRFQAVDTDSSSQFLFSVDSLPHPRRERSSPLLRLLSSLPGDAELRTRSALTIHIGYARKPQNLWK
ncbi:hypothetical protein HMPREF9004_1719 [Schaalia cardiffensis F0333]|uniref:Uncharacterized protein n=1 Tax=Schaalia cardiffensis F0333 TaxID=888050 RepID=N6WC62_9ACTO|nr:hypothetical protein HMPREF9004_1719 [Schaalia cardiffensis F0333]